MYEQEKVKPYDGDGERGELIEEMFSSIAPTYDTLNHHLSGNIDKGRRKKATRQLQPFRLKQMLDIATGTGDFAILATKELKPEHLIGADISEGMMVIGREKVKTTGLSDIISFQKEDCLSLSLPDNTFDAVTAVLGIHNFQNLDKGLTEICRVLKRGGHLGIVELTTSVKFPMKQLFRIYSNTFLLNYAKFISKGKGVYKHPNRTVEALPQSEKMTEIFQKAGLAKSSFRRLTFDICTMYFTEKQDFSEILTYKTQYDREKLLDTLS